MMNELLAVSTLAPLVSGSEADALEAPVSDRCPHTIPLECAGIVWRPVEDQINRLTGASARSSAALPFAKIFCNALKKRTPAS